MSLQMNNLLFISSGSTEIKQVWNQLKNDFDCIFIELQSAMSGMIQKKQLLPSLLTAKRDFSSLKN